MAAAELARIASEGVCGVVPIADSLETRVGSIFSFLIQDFDPPLVSGLFGGRMLQKAFASFSVIAL
jgi:hypothetical protein